MLYFKPIQKNKSPKGYYRAGISLGKAEKNGLLIAGLIKNSSADSSGIKIGDILLKVNEIKALPDNYFKIKKLLSTEGTLNLHIQRNDSILEKTVPVNKLL